MAEINTPAEELTAEKKIEQLETALATEKSAKDQALEKLKIETKAKKTAESNLTNETEAKEGAFNKLKLETEAKKGVESKLASEILAKEDALSKLSESESAKEEVEELILEQNKLIDTQESATNSALVVTHNKKDYEVAIPRFKGIPGHAGREFVAKDLDENTAKVDFKDKEYDLVSYLLHIESPVMKPKS